MENHTEGPMPARRSSKGRYLLARLIAIRSLVGYPVWDFEVYE
jgi:hypothetical protein